MNAPVVDQQPEHPDQEMIKGALDHIVSRRAGPQLRLGCMWALMMAFDKQLLYGPFVAVVNDATRLMDYLGRHEMLHSIRDAIGEALPNETFENANKALTANAEEVRISLLKQMELVFQCPQKTGRNAVRLN